ncbi:MAG: ABC transporter ATP-binding protein [Bacilli bacterium]
MIEINNVTKSYGQKVILKDISTIIKKNEITAFIGSNGAGKSTLLNILTRLDQKYQGQILIDGKNINDYTNNELALKVSFLKQDNNIKTKITVKELVQLGRYPHSKGKLTNKDYESVNQALHYLDLIDIQDRYLDELSGGQRQRVLIAMVVAQDSEYILLDEPLNNLDMYYATNIMKILKKLCHELKKTIIIVIHDINYTSVYANQIIAFKKGRVIKEGASYNIINKDSLQEIFGFEFKIIEDNNIRFAQYYE